MDYEGNHRRNHNLLCEVFGNAMKANNEEDLYERLNRAEAAVEYFKTRIEDWQKGLEKLRLTVRLLHGRMDETERRLSNLEQSKKSHQ